MCVYMYYSAAADKGSQAEMDYVFELFLIARELGQSILQVIMVYNPRGVCRQRSIPAILFLTALLVV